MNMALHITKRQMVLLALLLVVLLATTLLVIHTTMPVLWHVITLSPRVLNRQP